MSLPIIVQYKINAPVEKVWRALTDKNEMKSWYFDIGDFEPEVGKEFNFYEPGGENKFHHQCKIVEIVPNQILKYSWSYPDFSEAKTIVTWELLSDNGATLVKITHEDIENFNDLGDGFSRESFTGGWNSILGESLKEYLEK
ncbi:SRPBCC domain-containing protein [Chryseobacterium lactis]|uniref:SRPBCC domain-containing protein n=1 Tax=Chryseobacterium lactis TaxID=1241981 RepID=A0A3G6RNA6_CHRLC|nr:SRPBCC domain-containing protein [Chryseobacterium lactis]AZA84291.1 SRPBCC domain-containing protein [Chryseobacterium lactis]AZB04679.1 SRPBCC domain-containing protein [Chryseobacterium lactis]PNW14410.1 SRPBCC domain-containing protein [Chryseobacterium lactis]